MRHRRTFLRDLTNMAMASTAAVTAGAPIVAYADMPKVDENDPQAKAMGYVSDTTKTDMAKFARHTAAQKCDNCVLLQGKTEGAQGLCLLFSGKTVSVGGWCSAYGKKT